MLNFDLPEVSIGNQEGLYFKQRLFDILKDLLYPIAFGP